MGNKNISCLIVDDEPLSREVLKDYVDSCPELQLAGICKDALEAGNLLRKQDIDLLFLDINMPRLSGINFIKGLSNPPLFIFITAYPEFALEGFEVDAVDYLLKPVSFDRFRKAVNRALERIVIQNNSFSGSDYIMVKADKKNHLVYFKELIAVEAMGDYVSMYTEEKKLMVHSTLKEIILRLPSQFVQIHKSFVINISRISYLEGNQVVLGTVRFPVSNFYKENLLQKLHP